MKYVSVLLARVEDSMIEQQGTRWIIKQDGFVHKFSSKLEAENFLGVENAEKENSEKLETKTSWSNGLQQTKAYSESPKKKSHRGGKSWNKN